MIEKHLDEFQVFTSDNGKEALKIVRDNDIDIVLTDVRMPNMTGVALLKYLKEFSPKTQVILITAYADVNLAVDTIKLGAYDYIEKPLTNKIEKVLVSIRNAVKHGTLETKVENLELALKDKYKISNIIGTSDEMKRIIGLINKLSGSDVNILIRGESGTGKELLAKTIHYSSTRTNENFMTVPCKSIPDNTICYELFGSKMAETENSKDGVFKTANHGTVFLDGIGDLPNNVQGTLLRTIQENEIYPVGSPCSLNVNVRIIASTEDNLEQSVQEGKFREDLFYRLNMVTINIPPLRKRKGDIPILLDHFLDKFNKNGTKHIEGVEPNALEALMKYNWPGNIRELENTIERAFAVATGSKITESDLPPEIVDEDSITEAMPCKSVNEFERMLILRTLLKNKNNYQDAAKDLNMSLSTLYRKVKKHDIQTKDTSITHG